MPKLQRVFLDYESALWIAARQTWENITIRGCSFHWQQRIFKKIRKHNLEVITLNSEDIVVKWNNFKGEGE